MMWTKEKFGRLTLATTYSNFQSAYWNWLRGGEALAEAILAQQAQESDGPLGDTMAVMGQQLTDENTNLRTQLAQRDGELEALRNAYKEADAVADWALNEVSISTGYGGPAESRVVKMYDRLIAAKESLAVLSDNQESPALTDKEEGE